MNRVHCANRDSGARGGEEPPGSLSGARIAALLLLFPVATLGGAVLTGCNRTGADAKAPPTPVAVYTPHKMATPPLAAPAAVPGTRSDPPVASQNAAAKGNDPSWVQRTIAYHKKTPRGSGETGSDRGDRAVHLLRGGGA
jgi:hypothetical protein